MSLHEGIAHHQAGRLAEAERCYRAVLATHPNDPDALHLLGVIAYQVKQWRPAIELISRALAIQPNAAMYHNNIGNALRGAGELDRAMAAYSRAVELQPDYADAHGNIGTGRRDQARFNDAVAAYETCLRYDPALAKARGDFATALKDQGRVEEAIAQYRQAVAQDSTLAEVHSHLLYALHASDQLTPKQLFEEHLAWARLHAGVHGAGRARLPPSRELSAIPGSAGGSPSRDVTPNRPLRVGFVSPDFRDHPVARFLRPIVEHRDRDQFKFIAYSSVDRPDEVTNQLRAQFDEWYDVAPLADAQLADVIRLQHKIDILIDLAGHTGGTRMPLFVRKPAPVQISYLGYPDTSGIAQMDFRITDAISDLVGVTDALHTEKLLRLEGCFLAYTLLDDPAAQPPLDFGELSRAASSRNGPITFGSFNNLAKISPTTTRLWTRVLNAIPDSRMIIKTTSLGDPPTLALARDRFAALGLPMERVELLGPERTQGGHLAQYARLDVALDTFPYNGTTTTCEALSMGVPVVSLFGQHHASRVSLSILTAAGFGQWATDDSEKFIAIAKELAGQSRSLRPQMRDRLRASTLCDGKGFARRFESALRQAWQA